MENRDSLKLIQGNIQDSPRPSSSFSDAIGGLFLASTLFAGIYATYTSMAWLAVLWCNEVTINARKRLAASSLGLENRNDFSGWRK
jgi:hypothetical protein